MPHCDTLITPEWCATVDTPQALLTEHAVAVTDGRIVAVLPRSEAEQRFSCSRHVDRPGHLLIPGFVNAHAHAAMTLLRGYGDDLRLEDWLRSRIWPTERRWVGPEFVRDGVALAIAEMLRGGTTCFSDQYFFPEITASTAIDMHMRAVIGTPVLDFRTEWAGTATEYLEKGASLVHDAYADHPLIRSAFAPHSTYALSDESLLDLRVMADQLDVPVQIHLHETAEEIRQAVDNTGMRPIERLTKLGLVNRSLLAVHAVHVTPDEITQFAEAGVAVAHCPRSNMKLASGIAPVMALLDAGVTVGIGTDGPACNNAMDMLLEMDTAALLAKVSNGNAAAVPAGQALWMATAGSAAALGLSDEIGSISVGKWADLTCVDLSTANTQPVYDPISQLVYAARSDQVADVWVAGRHRVEGGQLKDTDIAGICRRADEWRERIAEDGNPDEQRAEAR